MHNAPSVLYPVGRSFWALAFVALCWVGGALATIALLAGAALPDGRGAIVVAAWLASGVAAGWAWWRTPGGDLLWDGRGWRWAGGEITVERVALDLQAVLLLRWRGADGARGWLLAERSRCPQLWGDLRRAVYSRRPNQPAPSSPVDAAPT